MLAAVKGVSTSNGKVKVRSCFSLSGLAMSVYVLSCLVDVGGDDRHEGSCLGVGLFLQ